MSTITRHEINACNKAIRIEADERETHGNMSHVYTIAIGDKTTVLSFQNGPIGEVGVNGITHEALIVVLIDRLQGAQKGKYACRENALMLTKLEEALMWSEERTRGRMARGVEGTHTV